MIVKELKEQLAYAKEEDEVFVQFPDMGTGGYDDTDEVELSIEAGRATIIAAIL